MPISWAKGDKIVDKVDGSLLNAIQTNFPLSDRPYQILGELTGTSEEEAWQRVQALRTGGTIRRLGAVLDSARLGYKSTLCAAQVPADKIQILTELLRDIPGVTHNYLRNHEYNIWFTLIAPSRKEMEKTLDPVKEIIGTEKVYCLPALRLFKISVDFEFDGDKHGSAPAIVPGSRKLAPYPVKGEEKMLIRELQGNIPESLAPFAEIAGKLGWDEEEVIWQARNLLRNGVIRRFGAVLRHQKAGFTVNAMGVWQVPEMKIEEAGKIMASFREVSHCYQRPVFADWPYNLFTMIHARSESECAEIMGRISQATGINDYTMLLSVKELKKTSMQYYMEKSE